MESTTAEQRADGIETLLTYRQVAKLLGCTDRAIYTWVSTGELPAIKLGRLVRSDPADVRRFVEARKSGGRS